LGNVKFGWGDQQLWWWLVDDICGFSTFTLKNNATAFKEHFRGIL
jgi:hypothetical protein